MNALLYYLPNIFLWYFFVLLAFLFLLQMFQIPLLIEGWRVRMYICYYSSVGGYQVSLVNVRLGNRAADIDW